MDADERKFWEAQFRSLEVNWKLVIDESKSAAKEYGAIAANIDHFIGKGWYEKPENWIRIISTIVVSGLFILVLLKGGHIKYGDLEVSLGTGTYTGTGALNK